MPYTRRAALSMLAAISLASLPAHGQSKWSSQPIRLVVNYPAGGAPDIFTRTVGEQLGKLLGTTVVIDNKPGASGILGVQAVAGAAANGHTLAYVSSGQVTFDAMNPNFDLLKLLKPVVRLSTAPFVVLVASDSPYRTLDDLLRAGQANPGKLTYGTAGRGSPAHMAEAYLEDAVKNFQALHVPYKGAVESINAILGHQIDFTIGVLGPALSQITAGKVRALAVTTSKRIPELPNVPTITEVIKAPYPFQSWGGFMAPAATPDNVVAELANVLTKAAQSAPVTTYLANSGGALDLSTSPAAFGESLKAELAAEKRIVKKLKLDVN